MGPIATEARRGRAFRLAMGGASPGGGTLGERALPWTWLSGLEPFGDFRYLPAMPIYEFHCGKCEKDSEILVRSSDWKGTPCPHCGSTKLTKKFSTFASSTGGGGEAPSCTGTPHSCGMCVTGRPH